MATFQRSTKLFINSSGTLQQSFDALKNEKRLFRRLASDPCDNTSFVTEYYATGLKITTFIDVSLNSNSNSILDTFLPTSKSPYTESYQIFYFQTTICLGIHNYFGECVGGLNLIYTRTSQCWYSYKTAYTYIQHRNKQKYRHTYCH